MAALLDIFLPGVPHALRVVLGVTILFVSLAAIVPKLSVNFFRLFEFFLSRFAARKTLSIIVLFITVIVVRLALLPQLPLPVPGIHDEYSYLLMADTFAHGRLANPTHPLWISFESFHINWFPAYASKYPPGQGAVLALGQWLSHPWIGVLLSVAAMCAAILWMLQAWLPARWAFLGAALVALKFGIASYWINSYWGGAVAAIGGALVLGAMPRIVRSARTRDALLLGLGIAILANTRPYEGVIFCLPVAGWFLWWLAGKTNPQFPARIRLIKVLAPLVVVLALTIGFIGYYNWRLTGNALLFPHVLNSRTYRSMGLFLWEHPKAPLLPALPFVFRDRKMRLPLLIFLLGTVAYLTSIWSFPHYAAPLTCVIFLLLVQAIRHLRTMRLGRRPVGLALSWAVVFLLATEIGFSIRHHICDPLEWTCQGDPSRAAIAAKLSQMPGKHLIVVRYEEDHNLHDEWVYNGAEIDNAKVLWARELDAAQNAKLFAYFKDRQIWLVEPDTDNTELIPYQPPESPPAQP